MYEIIVVTDGIEATEYAEITERVTDQGEQMIVSKEEPWIQQKVTLRLVGTFHCIVLS